MANLSVGYREKRVRWAAHRGKDPHSCAPGGDIDCARNHGRKSMAFDVAGRTDPVTASQGRAMSAWIRGNATHDSEGLWDVERLAQGANESLVESMLVSEA